MKKTNGDKVDFIIGYVMALFLSVVFGLYLSGRIGWFFLAALIIAPVCSALMTFIISRYITVTYEGIKLKLNKGDSFTLKISAVNHSYLPTPPVTLRFNGTPAVKCSINEQIIAIMPRDITEFEVNYKANIWGRHGIDLPSAEISDYFGFFKFKLKTIGEEGMISVIPDIPDFPADCTAVRSAEEISALYDDSEETRESSTGTIGGLVGFECREYAPGDPIKRINWKLSARKDTLYVRLDDEVPCSRIGVVLDSVYRHDRLDIIKMFSLPEYADKTKDEVILLNAQNCIELTLSAIRQLIMKSYSVSFFIYGKYGWENFEVNDEADLEEIRLLLADHSFSEDSGISRFPDSESISGKGGSSSFIFSTPCFDSTASDSLGGVGIFVTIMSTTTYAETDIR